MGENGGGAVCVGVGKTMWLSRQVWEPYTKLGKKKGLRWNVLNQEWYNPPESPVI